MPKKKQKEPGDINLFDIIKKYGDEDRAREYVESLRWPNGPVCPHCGATEVYRLTPKPVAETDTTSKRKPGRKGLLKCKVCRKQFTVMVNTIFSDSHIPLSKWVIAIHLLCSSKKGMSAHQIHRMLEMTYKSAWFMMHRIRYAMDNSAFFTPFTGIVEADETYIGGKSHNMHKSVRKEKIQGRGAVNKAPVFTLVQRGGNVKSTYVQKVTGKNLKAALSQFVHKDTRLMTDESPCYFGAEDMFKSHQSVCHSAEEYVRGDVHVNSAESFHAILKRGIIGVYHHVSTGHLGHYLNEFDFRFNMRMFEDGDRLKLAIRSMEGKRLYFRQPKHSE